MRMQVVGGDGCPRRDPVGVGSSSKSSTTGVLMKVLKTLIAVALISTAGAVALPSIAFAAGEEAQYDYRSTDNIKSMVSQYREYIAKMSPENRAKMLAMYDKVMQMEMDMKSAQMKMDMDLAKARRDLELFITTH
jgi:hypothetical protein